MTAPKRPRLKVEECVDLNADQLRQEGALRPGTRSTVDIYWNDDLALVTRLEATPQRLFVTGASHASPMSIERQGIKLASTACTYGGCRTYFLCPGDGCRRRSIRLYLVDGVFRCRRCHGLLYASQTKDRFDRLLWQANKIRQQLGGEPGTSRLIAGRPRGMWKKTYREKRNAIRELEGSAWRHLAVSRGFMDQMEL